MSVIDFIAVSIVMMALSIGVGGFILKNIEVGILMYLSMSVGYIIGWSNSKTDTERSN